MNNGIAPEWKLEKNSAFDGRRGPLVLVVMDGVGIGRQDEGKPCGECGG